MLAPSWPTLLLLCAAAFLVGSIPFGLVVGRLRGVDLRALGSGNIGAANAFRTLGAGAGLVVLLLDGAKGWGCVTLAGALFALPGASDGAPSPALAQVLVGLSAIVGHNNSIYLGFKGGKGIATMFGVLLALSPTATGVAAVTWLTVLVLTRYASVASLAAAASIPLCFAWHGAPMAWLGFGIVAFVMALVRHRSNLVNLAQGREPRFGTPKHPPSSCGSAEGSKAP